MTWRASSLSPESFIKSAFAHAASFEDINKYLLDKDGNIAAVNEKFAKANLKAKLTIL